MAHVTVDKLVGKIQRVKAKMDVRIAGVSVSAGDTIDVAEREAHFLKSIDRVEFVDAAAKK